MSTTTRTITPPLDPWTVELANVQLVEASAGTGKTFAIAALFLRLLLEKRLSIDRIAVVTFTKAATEELKQRIRARLVDARRALHAPADADPFITALLARLNDTPAVLERQLDYALRGFDQVAIHTIHGFAHRLLKDRAFTTGLSMATELEGAQGALRQAISEDYWRRNICAAPPDLVASLVAQKTTPIDLLQTINAHIGRPYSQVLAPSEDADSEQLASEYQHHYDDARGLWHTERETIRTSLVDAKLNRTSYKEAAWPGLFDDLDTLFDAERASHRDRKRAQQVFEKLAQRTLVKKTNKGHPPPRHRFFEVVEQLSDLDATLDNVVASDINRLRLDLLECCDTEIPRRNQRAHVQSYDDLLLNLHRALHRADSEAERVGAERLSETIRQRYAAILIDEFQDTDPIQYEIFHRLFGDHSQPMFLVGDPKQAIYSFRGADVYAYLRAPEDAAACFTMARNWRSEPGLVEAVNTLFQRNPRPFLVDAIRFYPVEAKPQELESPERATELPDHPLQFWLLDHSSLRDDRANRGKDKEPKSLTKGAARDAAFDATATQIAYLLNQGVLGTARIDGRPLHGGDIAVLVRTNSQGQQMRAALQRRGVYSVQQTHSSVFESDETEPIERLMHALLDPERDDWLRSALSSGLFGLDANTLWALNADDTLWDHWAERFRRYQGLWRDRGFLFAWQTLVDECDIVERILSAVNGERTLTNLQHLAELLQQAAYSNGLRPDALLGWLVAQRQNAANSSVEGDTDASQQRLESDAELVQIVTIHKSKGLEYPVVFCPCLWDVKLFSADAKINPVVQFHDPECDARATLDFGSPAMARSRRLATEEEFAEQLRLLYVALTRAKHRCHIVWGKVKDADQSALAWLLHPPPAAPDEASGAIATLKARFGALDAVSLRGELDALAAAAPGAIGVADLPQPTPARFRPQRIETAHRGARVLSRAIPAPWRISSFSALSTHLIDAEQAERPDHDAIDLPAASIETTREIEIDPHGPHAFPRGARAGSCLHRLFELSDFSRAARDARRALAERVLAEFAFDAEWLASALAIVENTLHTALDDSGLRLADIERAHRRDEMAFHFPLQRLRSETVREVLSALRPPYAAAAQRLHAPTLEGYMKGYIDLVFEANGRFYIVDYKSNWLGPDTSAYRPETIETAMLEHDYWLQYLIYTVALHRYLRLRVPDYDYRRHFGGVFYLFVRGMSPTCNASGVYHDQPSAALIERLDRSFAGCEPVSTVED